MHLIIKTFLVGFLFVGVSFGIYQIHQYFKKAAQENSFNKKLKIETCLQEQPLTQAVNVSGILNPEPCNMSEMSQNVYEPVVAVDMYCDTSNDQGGGHESVMNFSDIDLNLVACDDNANTDNSEALVSLHDTVADCVTVIEPLSNSIQYNHVHNEEQEVEEVLEVLTYLQDFDASIMQEQDMSSVNDSERIDHN